MKTKLVRHANTRVVRDRARSVVGSVLVARCSVERVHQFLQRANTSILMHSIVGSSERPVGASLHQRKPVKSAHLIPANHPAGIDERAAIGDRIAGEGGNLHARLQLPYLQRLVPGRGNRTLAVRRHRYSKDPIGVAFQRVQAAARLQFPYLQRIVTGR